MFNHLHQIEAVLKPFDSTYLGLNDEASIGRVNQGTHKQKKKSKSRKSSNNRPKTTLALQFGDL